MDQNVLSILVFLPLVAALGMALVPAGNVRAARIYALVASGFNSVFALAMLGTYDLTKAGYQFEIKADWLPALGIRYHMGVDGISLVLVMLIALLTPFAVLASWKLIQERARTYYAHLLALGGLMMGAVVSVDVFLFYVFFELMLVPAFFLVGLFGGEGRVKATTRFVVYTLVGSLFMFVAILVLANGHHAATGTWSFAIPDLMQHGLTGPTMWWAFAAFLVAFGIKAGLFPFHTWAPDTYVEAPAPVTFLVSGIMGKLGVYGFLRFAIPFFPAAFAETRTLLMAIAAAGVLYCAWVALMQPDIKRMLAYSSISHMAVIMLGVFALDAQAWSGVVFMFMAHALATGALFLMVGMLAERRGTAISQYGGIASTVPWFTTVFVLIAMASIGLPGLNGFIGEFLILLGAYAAQNVVGIIATTSVIFGACYMLWMVSRTFFGEAPKGDQLADLSGREALVLVPLALVIIVTGFAPQPVLSRIDPAVKATLGGLKLAEAPGQTVAAPLPSSPQVPVVPAEAAAPGHDAHGGHH